MSRKRFCVLGISLLLETNTRILVEDRHLQESIIIHGEISLQIEQEAARKERHPSKTPETARKCPLKPLVTLVNL